METAIDTEFFALLESGVVGICDPKDVQPGDDLIPSLCILSVKENGRKKARIVACGNFASASKEGVYSSVVHHTSWVSLLSILIPLGARMCLIDITTAFLQSDVSKANACQTRTFLRPPSLFMK